jgi:hypothetical protein
LSSSIKMSAMMQMTLGESIGRCWARKFGRDSCPRQETTYSSNFTTASFRRLLVFLSLHPSSAQPSLCLRNLPFEQHPTKVASDVMALIVEHLSSGNAESRSTRYMEKLPPYFHQLSFKRRGIHRHCVRSFMKRVFERKHFVSAECRQAFSASRTCLLQGI